MTARVDPRTGWVVVLSALDNLVKGASGQAVQCANLALGLPEATGLPTGRGVPVSITTPKGFVASGLASGSRRPGRSTSPWWPPTTAVAVPDRGHLHLQPGRGRSGAGQPGPPGGHRRAGPPAVVVRSGNANAATGDRGRADAARMCALVAVGPRGGRRPRSWCAPPASSGSRCPWPPIESGIPAAGGRPVRVAPRPAADAASGILTTDSGPQGGRWSSARPSPWPAWPRARACWRPDMATMLAFLTTDAAVEPGPLADLLRIAVGTRSTRCRWTAARRPTTPCVLHGLGTGRAGRSQRGGRRGDRGVRRAGRPDDGRRRRGVPDLPGPGDRGPVRRRGPPGRPQGGRLAAGQVLAQRRGPLLGPGGQRPGLGRRRLRHGPPGRSPTAA